MSAFEETIDSSDEENPTVDEDACNDIELSKLFQTQFHLATEECVSLKKSYVLQLAASKSWDTIAAGTSTKEVHVFDLGESGLRRRPLGNELQRTANNSAVCGVRFANTDPNLLYVGTTDGTIFTYDLRAQASVHQYTADTASVPDAPPAAAGTSKPLTCFDLNANDRVLCAGTEQVGSDTYLLFFDTRKQSAMGGYWESHSEDVCTVRFHPTQPDRLASGSADGLINVYDISKGSEDDALEQCMNTESTVQKLQWHRGPGVKAAVAESGAPESDAGSNADRDLLSCITHVNALHLYDVEEQEQVFAQDRDAMTAHIRRTSPSDCNVVGVHSTDRPGNLFVLAGSNFNRGECLRSLTVQPAADGGRAVAAAAAEGGRPVAAMQVQAGANFGQSKQVVRCSLYNENTQLLVTGGESGLVTLWAPGAAASALKLKEKSKDRNRKHKSKPY